MLGTGDSFSVVGGLSLRVSNHPGATAFEHPSSTTLLAEGSSILTCGEDQRVPWTLWKYVCEAFATPQHTRHVR